MTTPSPTPIEPVKPTMCYKGLNGWKAETHYALTEGFTLKVHTVKTSRGVDTVATAHKVDNGFEIHRLHKDYYAILRRTFVRATEKQIQAQHDSVLREVAPVIAAAVDHYKALKAREQPLTAGTISNPT